MPLSTMGDIDGKDAPGNLSETDFRGKFIYDVQKAVADVIGPNDDVVELGTTGFSERMQVLVGAANIEGGEERRFEVLEYLLLLGTPQQIDQWSNDLLKQPVAEIVKYILLVPKLLEQYDKSRVERLALTMQNQIVLDKILNNGPSLLVFILVKHVRNWIGQDEEMLSIGAKNYHRPEQIKGTYSADKLRLDSVSLPDTDYAAVVSTDSIGRKHNGVLTQLAWIHEAEQPSLARATQHKIASYDHKKEMPEQFLRPIETFCAILKKHLGNMSQEAHNGLALKANEAVHSFLHHKAFRNVETAYEFGIQVASSLLEDRGNENHFNDRNKQIIQLTASLPRMQDDEYFLLRGYVALAQRYDVMTSSFTELEDSMKEAVEAMKEYRRTQNRNLHTSEIQVNADEKISWKSPEEIVKECMPVDTHGFTAYEVGAILCAFHNRDPRDLLSKDIGIDFCTLPLITQVHAIAYIANLKNADERRPLWNTIRAADENLKNSIFTSFIGHQHNPGMPDIILDLANQEEGEQILAAYGDVVSEAQSSALIIVDMARNASNANLGFEEVYQFLIDRASRQLRDVHKHLPTGDRAALTEQFVQRSHEALGNIQHTKDIITLLPREDLAELNLDVLASIELRGPVPVREILESPDYEDMREVMVQAIRNEFPDEDDDDFVNRYLQKPDAYMYLSICNDKLLAFLGAADMDDDLQYLDWFFANPNAPVQGLAAATHVTPFRYREYKKGIYHVIKPWNRTCDIAIENLESVAFGITQKDDTDESNSEYKHRYLRFRKLTEDEEGAYLTRTMDAQQLAELTNCCEEDNKMYDAEIDGRAVKICHTKIKRRGPKEDIDPGDEDYFLYQQMEALGADNQFVMTRFLPGKNRKSRYCIFEQSQISRDRYDRLHGSIHTFFEKEHGRKHPHVDEAA